MLTKFKVLTVNRSDSLLRQEYNSIAMQTLEINACINTLDCISAALFASLKHCVRHRDMEKVPTPNVMTVVKTEKWLIIGFTLTVFFKFQQHFALNALHIRLLYPIFKLEKILTTKPFITYL